ncbi:MAG: MoaD/ThiS family protein [Candidatus Woesearchaeota archaeon]
MKVFVESEDRYREVRAATVKDMLKKLKMNPAAVLVVVNNELATEDASLRPKDKVKILSVISGG